MEGVARESPFDDAGFDALLAQAVGEVPTDDVNLLAIGVDSLKFIQLMMEIEDTFDVFWPPEQLTDFGALTVVGELRGTTRRLVEATRSGS